jgi:hypothetical protein
MMTVDDEVRGVIRSCYASYGRHPTAVLLSPEK